MRKLLIAMFLLLSGGPLLAWEQKVDCTKGGTTLYEISHCKDQSINKLKESLGTRLTSAEVEQLEETFIIFCKTAWEPSKTVLIYPLTTRICVTRMLQVALDEMKSGATGQRNRRCPETDFDLYSTDKSP